MRSNIISHFIKEKISLSPMVTILMIPNELEYLKGLVKLAKWKRNDVLHLSQVTTIASIFPNLRRININQNCNKTIHLLVKMNNHIIQGLIDTRASMSIIAINLVREFGIMHLVASLKSYKIVSRMVT